MIKKHKLAPKIVLSLESALSNTANSVHLNKWQYWMDWVIRKKCDTNINSVINKIAIDHILWLILVLKKTNTLHGQNGHRENSQSLWNICFCIVSLREFTCSHLGSAVYFVQNAFENYIDQTKLERYSVSCNFQLFNMHGTKVTGSSLRFFFFSDRVLQTNTTIKLRIKCCLFVDIGTTWCKHWSFFPSIQCIQFD